MPRQELIKKALNQATPAQLIRVRAILHQHQGEYGYDSLSECIEQALKDFDRGVYDTRQIERLLDDKALGNALK